MRSDRSGSAASTVMPGIRPSTTETEYSTGRVLAQSWRVRTTLAPARTLAALVATTIACAPTPALAYRTLADVEGSPTSIVWEAPPTIALDQEGPVGADAAHVAADLPGRMICPRYGQPRSGGSRAGGAQRGPGSPPGAGRPLERSSRSRSNGPVRRRRTRVLSSANDGRTDARPGLVPSRASATCARLSRAMAGRGRDGCAG